MKHENNETAQRAGEVGELIDRRVAVYGDPVATFPRIAEVWSGILGVRVNATDVPLCLAGMKAVRAQVTPDYADNSDDIEGYLDIFRQLVGGDMIHARSIVDYLAAKDRRDRHPSTVADAHQDESETPLWASIDAQAQS